LDEHEDAALEFDDVDEVDEEPDQPGGVTGNMNAENVGDSGGAADDGHIAFVEVVEARWRSFTGQARDDDFCGEAAALDGDLSDAGKRLALFTCGVSEIAHDENFRMAGNGEIGLDFDAAGAVDFGVKALGNLLAERSGGDTASPEDGARGERVVAIAMFVGDAAGGDVRDEDAFPDFDAEASDEGFSFGGKIFREGIENSVAAFHKENAGFFGTDVAEIIAQGFAGDFGEGAGEF